MDYMRRANRKGLDFLITQDDFDEMMKNMCYICGKKPQDNHCNGVDRVNNDLGYISGNVKTCCGECNYMKREFDYDILMEKFKLIYENHKEDAYLTTDVNEVQINNIGRTNKKTKQQIANEAILRKETNKKTLYDRYNDEEYKWQRARELAEQRKLNK